jgi:MFS family permease
LLNILVRPIRAEVGIDDLQFSLLQGASFAIAYSVAAFPAAYLSDRYGPRRIMIAAVAFWSVMTLAFGLAESFSMLIITRIGLAVGEAGLSPSSIAMVRQTLRPDRQSFGVSILALGAYVGGGLSMLAGGPALAMLEANPSALPFGFTPWRALFAACAIIGIIALPLMMALPEADVSTKKTGATMRHFFIAMNERRGAALCYLSAYVGAMGLSWATKAWMPAIFVRSFGWDEVRTGVAYGTVYLIGGVIGALSAGRLTGLLTRRGVSCATVVVVRGAVALMSLAVLAAVAAPNGEIALAFLTLSLLAAGAILALGAFGFQEMFSPEFSARAVAIYLIAPGALGGAIGPSAVPLLQGLMGPGASTGAALGLFSAIVCVWALLWFGLFLKFQRPFASSLMPVAEGAGMTPVQGKTIAAKANDD